MSAVQVLGTPGNRQEEDQLLNWIWDQVKNRLDSAKGNTYAEYAYGDLQHCGSVSLIYSVGKNVVAAQVFPRFQTSITFLVTKEGVVVAHSGQQRSTHDDRIRNLGGKRFRTFEPKWRQLRSWKYRFSDRF